MKHPNGYGTVVRLSGKRRNPYQARKTKGYDDRGYPIYETIGYYPTREAGLIALAVYNNDPYDIDLAKITMKDLFDRWAAREFKKMPKKTVNIHRTSIKYCASLHNVPYKKIKAHHMQETIDNCGLGYATQGSIKSLWGNLDLYAMELDIISKKYSDLIHSAPVPPSCKKPFTEEEINRLWDHVDDPYVDTILIFMYSGWRITELLDMTHENVDIQQNIMRGGVKTKSGKERLVPIHPRILPLIMRYYNQDHQKLFLRNRSIGWYYIVWHDIMTTLGMNHTPHDCRHTFRTKLDSANANKVCIDLLMGHKSKDVGERIYTHKTIEELKTTVELLL